MIKIMKKNDIIAGLIFIALAIFIFTQTHNYPTPEKGHPGPDLFPNILAILFIAFGGALVLKARKYREVEIEETPGHRKVSNAIFVLGIVVAYVIVVNTFGFLITSSILLFILMKKLGVTLLRSAIASLTITFFINILFSKILRVPLPYGILGW